MYLQETRCLNSFFFVIIKEIKFISVLSNTNVDESNKERIRDLAVQTLVKRAIKKNEVERLKITQYNAKDIDRQISNIAKNLGLDREGLKIFMKKKNLRYDDIVKNFEIDLKWNTAIFKLYKNKISLNTLEIEDKINSELKKTKLNKSLLLSEIQVNLSSEGLELTTNKVLSKIEEVGFENAARDLGVSESAKNGGNIGWIKENELSKKIYEYCY